MHEELTSRNKKWAGRARRERARTHFHRWCEGRVRAGLTAVVGVAGPVSGGDEWRVVL